MSDEPKKKVVKVIHSPYLGVPNGTEATFVAEIPAQGGIMIQTDGLPNNHFWDWEVEVRDAE